MNMKRNLTIVMFLLLALTMWAQGSSVLDQLKADPKKSYGTDYPYQFANPQLTKAPKGYKPFTSAITAGMVLAIIGMRCSIRSWPIC